MFSLFRTKKKQIQPDTASDPSICGDAGVFEKIVPVLKVVDHEPAGSGSLVLTGEDTPVMKPFAGDLIVMYAEDLPDRFVYLSRKRVRELGLDVAALHALAVQNLARRTPDIKLHGSAPRYMITAGGNFEASLLLHPTLWESLAGHLPGSPIAVAPARDLLLVTSSEWEEGRAFLKEAGEKELQDKRYALSKRLFVRRNGCWIVDDLNA